MKLITPSSFEPFPEVVSAMSIKDPNTPNQLDMSLNRNAVQARSNRHQFCQELGFEPKKLLIPEQNHTDIIHAVKQDYRSHPGDALISNQPGWLLGVLVADCVPVLLYDPTTNSYGSVHSGWRGSAQNIAANTVLKMVKEFGVNPRNLYAWIGPSADKVSYQVEHDVASQFNAKYSQQIDADHWLFDNKAVVFDQLVSSGMLPERIEISSLDTISNPELHSDRRDKDDSGRMLAAIGLCET